MIVHVNTRLSLFTLAWCGRQMEAVDILGCSEGYHRVLWIGLLAIFLIFNALGSVMLWFAWRRLHTLRGEYVVWIERFPSIHVNLFLQQDVFTPLRSTITPNISEGNTTCSSTSRRDPSPTPRRNRRAVITGSCYSYSPRLHDQPRSSEMAPCSPLWHSQLGTTLDGSIERRLALHTIWSLPDLHNQASSSIHAARLSKG